MKRPKPFNKSFKNISRFVKRPPAIREVLKEPTAGGIIFRENPKTKKTEILLIQDAKDRWTIPKGHIEEGERAEETAAREIMEETGLSDLDIINWVGKINFQYRRKHSLVLMTTDIFLIRATRNTDKLIPEDWMNGIKWFSPNDALEKIEYEDIGKLILLSLKQIRQAKK